MGGVDQYISLLKWLAILKDCYTNSIVHPVASIQNNSFIKAKADSCATYHSFKKERITNLINSKALLHGPKATLPKNISIQATHSGLLLFAFSHLMYAILVYPGLSNKSLFSIGQ